MSGHAASLSVHSRGALQTWQPLLKSCWCVDLHWQDAPKEHVLGGAVAEDMAALLDCAGERAAIAAQRRQHAARAGGRARGGDVCRGSGRCGDDGHASSLQEAPFGGEPAVEGGSDGADRQRERERELADELRRKRERESAAAEAATLGEAAVSASSAAPALAAGDVVMVDGSGHAFEDASGGGRPVLHGTSQGSSRASDGSAGSNGSQPEDALAGLIGMGFDEAQAAAALNRFRGSTERAADWLLSSGGVSSSLWRCVYPKSLAPVPRAMPVLIPWD